MILTSKIILFSSLFYMVMSRHMDFRERFLERKRLRALNAQRVNVLNKLANTVILDDITYHRRLRGRMLKKMRAIEKDFRRLLAMDGMKYNYKRDLFWRTWRSIPLLNGATKQIVCYKCNNLKHANGTTCKSCGMWSIEDSTPPCPFEFFSLKSEESFCGANITQFKDVRNKCPSVIKFSDLTATCDNPIETQWRFTKKYGVMENYDNVICENQDFCEIFTSYEITPDLVIFRIINSTNHVIYSRIMKSKNKNYICIDDCGHFNPETRKVTKANSKPLKLDFLARKMKRNDLNEIGTKKQLLKEINEKITKRQDLLNGKKEEVTKSDPLNEMNKSATKRKKLSVKKKEKPNDSETKSAVLNKTYVNDMVRDEVLNEINNSDAKGDSANEINDRDAKEDLVNETSVSTMFTYEVPDEKNDSDAYVEVLNDSTHVSSTERQKFIHELMQMEKDLSTLDGGGNKFDLMSVEVKSLHNIKSRGKQINFSIENGKTHRPKTAGQQNTLASEEDKHSDSILARPTVKLKKIKYDILYEDASQDLEYA